MNIMEYVDWESRCMVLIKFGASIFKLIIIKFNALFPVNV